jgi:hypothetical protein
VSRPGRAGDPCIHQLKCKPAPQITRLQAHVMVLTQVLCLHRVLALQPLSWCKKGLQPGSSRSHALYCLTSSTSNTYPFIV